MNAKNYFCFINKTINSCYHTLSDKGAYCGLITLVVTTH